VAGEGRAAPRALLFDVQGTATDFHATVSEEAQRISGGRHPNVDWGEFVGRWRTGYSAALESATRGSHKWVSVHSVYRRVLDSVLDGYGITDLSATDREELTLAWQRLRPWPDVVPGLTRMRTTFTVATLSNADVSAVVSISRRGALPWDAVFTAEMAGAFKPDPVIYHMAATYLGLHPADIMMVASHKYDIRAAGRLGFQTAFIARPLEFGVGGAADVMFDDEFDINAHDFLDLAAQLGC
jgi:2-haloacid dehalogenase